MMEKIRWEPNLGGVWEAEIQDENGIKESLLAIFIPSNFDKKNIQVGQELMIEVKIDRNGVLNAQNISKL